VKRTSLPLRTAPMRRTGRLRPRSAKTARTYVARRALVAGLLEQRPWCERCGQERSTDVHEPLMRSQGGATTDPAGAYFCLCRRCHGEIHASPAQSYAEGWLIRRGAA